MKKKDIPFIKFLRKQKNIDKIYVDKIALFLKGDSVGFDFRKYGNPFKIRDNNGNIILIVNERIIDHFNWDAINTIKEYDDIYHINGLRHSVKLECDNKDHSYPLMPCVYK